MPAVYLAVQANACKFIHRPHVDRLIGAVYAEGIGRRKVMAKLALVYGMRLLPEEDLGEVKDATIVLKNGRTARVTMHLIEGSKEEIESTFRQSIEAFFDMYPEI
jgi:hypothetical protein